MKSTWFIFIFALTLTQTNTLANTFVSGNTLLTPQTIEKIVKTVIANTLKTNLSSDELTFQIPSTAYEIKIPQKPSLRAITHTLGLENSVQISFDPIDARFDFTPHQLKITVNKIQNNTFRITAQWSVNELHARSKVLNLYVPKGVFDQDFTVSSTPIEIGLRQDSNPITAELSLTANLSNDGAKITLESFDTNINHFKPEQNDGPILEMNFGPIKVNGQPLELEITTNGKTIKTTELEIRKNFHAFAPEIMKKIQQQLAQVVQTQFKKIAIKLEDEEAFKLSFTSNDILKKFPPKDAAMNALLTNIDADFNFSYVQSLTAQKLFTTQVSSKVCVDKICLLDQWRPTAVTSKDTESMMGDDAGILIYESWLQNIIHSAAFQKRIRNYYNQSIAAPGVVLGKEGVKVHFNPRKNAFVAVLNLVIHIPSTVKKDSTLQERLRKQFGGTWEYWFGSGAFVKIPVEVTAAIKGITTNANGTRTLNIETSLPFRGNQTLLREYTQYPSNVENMTSMIRKEVLSAVNEELTKAIPKNIQIELSPINIKGIQMNVNQVIFTQNKGLLVSGCVQ